MAATIRRVIREGWSVGERQMSTEHEEWRPAGWRDIAVLLPARTSLPFLERALEASGIPYRAETSSLVYGTREIRDLMLVARAVDDPTDSLAVVSALRTTAFGCGDDDLFVWHERYRGRWDHQRGLPDDAPIDHPVALGITWLGEQHRQRRWLSPNQMLERILRERRFFELAAEERRPRDLWRRLRFVLDQCRAWEEAGGNTLREYLQWVEGQSSEGTRVVETVLPETDDDAVRILTVHGAKGLEFPITILSGLTTTTSWAPRRVEVRFPPAEGWAIRLSNRMSTSDFEETQAVEEQMDAHERTRLLYVASTRARDHLVVSVHRKAPGNRASPTAAEDLYAYGWDPDRVELLDVSDEPQLATSSTVRAPDHGYLPTLAEWRSAHDAALASASQSVATSATRLAAEAAAAREDDEELRMTVDSDPGLAKGPRDIDLPPWQKGRYGSAIGRAVHGALQTVDLASGDGPGGRLRRPGGGGGRTRQGERDRSTRAGRDRFIHREDGGQDIVIGARSTSESLMATAFSRATSTCCTRMTTVSSSSTTRPTAWRTEAELDAKVERYTVQLRIGVRRRGAPSRRARRREAVLLFPSEG